MTVAPIGSAEALEVRVLSARDYSTVLCWANDYETLNLVPMLSQQGSGSITLLASSPAVQTAFIPDGGSYSVHLSNTASSFQLTTANAAFLPNGTRFQLGAGSPSRPAAGPTVYTVYSQDAAVGGFVQLYVTPSFPAPLTSSDTVQVQLQPGSALLSYENLFQVLLYGTVVFEFLGETVTEQQVDPSEATLITIAGPDTSQMLSWGRAMPVGWPTTIYALSGIIDNFPGPSIDASVWNLSSGSVAITTAGTVTITATNVASALAGGPFYALNSSISAQITAMAPGGLDGSELTQMYVSNPSGSGYALMGLSSTAFYCAIQNTSGSVTTHTMPAFDPTAHAYWRIANLSGIFSFWTSADGSTWALQWTAPTISPTWDYTRSNLYFTARYDTTGQHVLVTNLNAEVLVKPNAGPIFYSVPIMSAWLTLLGICQARGTLTGWTTGFTAAHDSASVNWTDSQSIQVPMGTDLLTLLQNYAGALNADWAVRPNRKVDVGLAGSIGTDYSQKILFYEGDGAVTKTRQRARNAIGNMVAASDTAGHVFTYQDTTSQQTWGNREWWVAAGGSSVDPSATSGLTQASLQQLKYEASTRTLAVLWGQPGKTPLRDFTIGDWVGVEASDQSSRQAVRVIGVAVAVAQDGTITSELTLETYRQFIELQLQYLINKFGGQFASTLGVLPTSAPTSGIGTSAGSVVQAPSLASLADVQGTTGVAAGNLLSMASTGYWGPVATLPASVIGNLGVLNINPYFAGGDGTGWSGFNGTFVVNPSPPAGSPFAYSGQFTVTNVTTPSANQASAPFKMVGGQAYMMSVWVYTPQTSVTIGFSWLNSVQAFLSSSTQTITVPANTWTQVTTVQSAPSSAVYAYPMVSPPSTLTNVVNFTGVLCLPQVPGSLIQAGTVTATQIAAATITAAQLAAGIVYAGIVDATTIQGATLIAGSSPNFQVIVSTSAGIGYIDFKHNQASIVDGLIQGAYVSGTFAQLLLNGPAKTTTGHKDFMGLMFNSSDGSSSANLAILYNDANAVAHNTFVVDYSGAKILAGVVAGVSPSTGLSPTNAAVAETWQSPTVSNVSGGSFLVRYKMVAEKNMIFLDVSFNACSATNGVVIFTFASGYQPGNASNLPMASSVQSTGQSPHLFIPGSGSPGQVQIWGCTSTASFGGKWLIPLD